MFCETAGGPKGNSRDHSDTKDRFPDKLAHHLVISDKINLVRLGPRGRGWVCEGGYIKRNSQLITVPRELILDASIIELDTDFGNIVGPLRSAGLDDRGVLALWYLLRRNSLQSSWGWYLSLLPSHYDLLTSHPLLSHERIPGTSIGLITDKMTNNISRQLKSIVSSIRQLDPENLILTMDKNALEEEWRLCHALVLSRSGLFDSVHYGTNWTDQPICILPGIDLVNHSDTPNARLVRLADGSVQLMATRDIPPGEEITISYWSSDENDSLSVEQVLFTFGFIGGLGRFLLPMISFDGADTDKRRALQRLVYVESKLSDQISDEIHTDDVASAVTYFAIQCMPEEALSRLTKVIVDEECVGERSKAVIDGFRSAGRVALQSEIIEWREMVNGASISHPVLLKYQELLIDTIDSFLRDVS